MAGGAVFKLGSFGNFCVLKKGAVGHRSAFAKASARHGGDDGHDRSFITRDFSRVLF